MVNSVLLTVQGKIASQHYIVEHFEIKYTVFKFCLL